MRYNRRQLGSSVAAGGLLISLLFVGIPAWATLGRDGLARSPGKTNGSRAQSRPAPAAQTATRYVVKRGDTLSRILAGRGVPQREIAQWGSAMRGATKAKRLLLHSGHVVTLQFARRGGLETLAYQLDAQTQVIVQRNGRRLSGRTEALPVKISVAGAQGVVDRNFHRAARRAGVPDQVISRMADILGWEFDFRRVQRGDRFRVVYERRVTTDGRVLPPGKILAAEIQGARRTVQAFYYQDGKETLYVDGKGRTLTQSLLRYPVEFTRISSVFARRRFHPILKKPRPHNGVDFAAPTGTPVRAAGDGKVAWAGRNGDYGNHVAVEHDKAVVTTYSHLRGIARGLRRGARVHQGQIIGWVGQTGLATGPHLHFALFRNKQYLNPLTARVALHQQVRHPARFRAAKQALLKQLASVPLPPTAGVAEPVTLAGLAPWQRLGPVSLTR